MLLCVFVFAQLYQYQYYSTGLLSTHDPFYEQQRHLLGPKKKKIKDEKKFKGKKKKGMPVSVPFKENKNKQEKHILKPQTRSTFSFKCLSFFL